MDDMNLTYGQNTIPYPEPILSKQEEKLMENMNDAVGTDRRVGSYSGSYITPAPTPELWLCVYSADCFSVHLKEIEALRECVETNGKAVYRIQPGEAIELKDYA